MTYKSPIGNSWWNWRSSSRYSRIRWESRHCPRASCFSDGYSARKSGPSNPSDRLFDPCRVFPTIIAMSPQDACRWRIGMLESVPNADRRFSQSSPCSSNEGNSIVDEYAARRDVKTISSLEAWLSGTIAPDSCVRNIYHESDVPVSCRSTERRSHRRGSFLEVGDRKKKRITPWWSVAGNDVVDTRKGEDRVLRGKEEGGGEQAYSADERNNRARTSCVLYM